MSMIDKHRPMMNNSERIPYGKLVKELISTEENFMKSLSKEDISSLLD
jgi:hypothetical protein